MRHGGAGLVRENVDLRAYNTLGISVSARHFASANTREDLMVLRAWARAEGLPLQILGGGSNIVLKDNLPGLVVHVALRGRRWFEGEDDDAILVLEAGESWHQAVIYAASLGYRGIENLALIPGTVGAAPVQNIGAYGVDLANTLVDVEVLDLSSGEIRRLDCEACRFAYRDSFFKQNPGLYLITQVRLKLSRNRALELSYQGLADTIGAISAERLTALDVAQAVMALRRSKLPDPESLPNAGSFFKNPLVSHRRFEELRQQWPGIVAFTDPQGMKLAAAWLIDRCGWKGYHEAHVGVHRHQALVLVNHSRGTGKEILDLAQRIQDDVYNHYGVLLEIEPRILP